MFPGYIQAQKVYSYARNCAIVACADVLDDAVGLVESADAPTKLRIMAVLAVEDHNTQPDVPQGQVVLHSCYLVSIHA